jgi:mono/diheme cytochrome c family protein
MKIFFYIVTCATLTAMVYSCSSVKREPGTVYMPDMAYSRTHESYAQINDSTFTNDTSALRSGNKYFFNASPVIGAIRRGDTVGFEIPQDKGLDTANYFASSKVTNPLGPLTKDEYQSIDRLYNINCGICHGTDLAGNGPLYKSGKLANQPANLTGTNAKYAVMTEGTMYYSITYGKNSMGGYASQLTKLQRWQITKYIKMKQAENLAPAKDTTK